MKRQDALMMLIRTSLIVICAIQVGWDMSFYVVGAALLGFDIGEWTAHEEDDEWTAHEEDDE